MTPKVCQNLSIATAVAVILAIATSWTGGSDSAINQRGEPFAPGLLDKANDIAEIRVEAPDGETVIKRDSNAFLDASGFPVNTDMVRRLVTSVALLTIEEKKTSDPKRYPDIQLSEPKAKTGAGTLVALKNASGQDIVSIVAGEKDFSVGGTNGGQYVRATDDPQSYLVRGSVRLPAARADWFERNLVKTDKKKIVKASLGDDGTAAFTISGKDGKHELETVPAEREGDEIKIDRVLSIFESLRFVDVRARSKDAEAKGPTLSAETADGLKFEVRSIGTKDEKDDWVRITATALQDSAKTEVGALREKLEPFDFRLTAREVEILGWSIDDITRKKEKPES